MKSHKKKPARAANTEMRRLIGRILRDLKRLQAITDASYRNRGSSASPAISVGGRRKSMYPWIEGEYVDELPASDYQRGYET